VSASRSLLVHGFPCTTGAHGASEILLPVLKVLPSTLLPGFFGLESSVLPVNLPPSDPLTASCSPYRLGFLTSPAAFDAGSGGLHRVRRSTSPYPVQLRFGPPDIRPHSPMPPRPPPPRCHIVPPKAGFATYIGSASCFLQTAHFWCLPLPRWRYPSVR
jgi:hypothetical protein